MKPIRLRRITRAALGVLVFLTTAIVLWYSITSFLGRREWAATRKDLENRGEKLSLLDFVPPPLADHLNFAAAPAFAELFDYQVKDATSWVAPNVKHRIPPENQQFAAVTNALGAPFGKIRRAPGELTDLAAVAAYYRAEGRLGNDNAAPAEAILEALAPARPVLDQIARHAERPGARFPVRYEDGISAAFPHLAPLQSMARLLNLRAVAALELGRNDEAAADLLLLLRLADALKGEPSLMALLVRISMLGYATQTVWEGLARGAWTDTQLATLQDRLTGYDLLAETAYALRAERGSILYLLESALRRNELGKLLASITQMTNDGPAKADSAGALLITTLYPRGWAYSDLAFMATVQQRWLDALENREGPLRPADFEFLDTEMRQWSFPKKIRHLASSVTLPALSSVAKRAASAQTRLDQSRTALALERYRRSREDFPATLDALVPTELNAVPTDVMTGRPMGYRRISPDDFVLWSVGWEAGKTDGKTPVPKTKDDNRTWRRLPDSGPAALSLRRRRS